MGVITIWGFTYPRLTDDDELIAPATIEEFYPLEGSTIEWKRIFTETPNDFEEAWSVIDAILNEPALLKENEKKILPLLSAISALSADESFEPPYFKELESSPDPYSRFRSYIRLIELMAENGNRSYLPVACKISYRYWNRSKCVVDYMIGLVALKTLEEQGCNFREFPSEWREVFGRAIRAEYYTSSPEEVGISFLYQKNKTWNELWGLLEFHDTYIASGDYQEIDARLDKVISEATSWPYTNLQGELLIAMALPSYSRVYEESVSLEEKIQPVGVGND